jgi:hypothetical protein
MAVGKATTKFLKRLIESHMVCSESGRYFLPKSYLSLIFNLEEIEKAVDEVGCPIDEKIGLAQEIYNHGARIFATLIKNGEEDLITEFRKHEVLNTDSPLDENLAKRIAGEFGVSFGREYQWQFLPYNFRQNMRDSCKNISHNGMIHPFVGEPEVVASGGFGEITKVKIFPSQQEFVPNKVSLILEALRFLKA